MLKKIIYDLKDVKIVDADDSEPKVVYKECNSGITIEVIVDEKRVDDVIDALKGNLPDDVLMALGIPASGEDLEEICEELKSLGYECSVKSEETDGEYCETFETILEKRRKTSKMIKIVIENGILRTYPAKGESRYLHYTKTPEKRTLEAVIEKEQFEDLYGEEDKEKALVRMVLGEEVNLDEPVDVLRYLEEKVGDYLLEVERAENYYRLYVEL